MSITREQEQVAPSVRSSSAATVSRPMPGVPGVAPDMDLQDRMRVFGAGGQALLSFLPWFALDIPKELEAFVGDASINGVHGFFGWLGFLSAVAAVVWHFAPGFRALAAAKLPAHLRPWAPVALSVLAFACGPVIFYFDSDVAIGFIGGRTFWFWAAFLAGATSAAGAIWKKALFRN